MRQIIIIFILLLLLSTLDHNTVSPFSFSVDLLALLLVILHPPIVGKETRLQNQTYFEQG
jgi:hypothetical protein